MHSRGKSSSRAFFFISECFPFLSLGNVLNDRVSIQIKWVWVHKVHSNWLFHSAIELTRRNLDSMSNTNEYDVHGALCWWPASYISCHTKRRVEYEEISGKNDYSKFFGHDGFCYTSVSKWIVILDNYMLNLTSSSTIQDLYSRERSFFNRSKRRFSTHLSISNNVHCSCIL